MATRSAWKERYARHALALATLSYTLGWTAHTTFVFYLAPIALRLGGHEGRDPFVFAGTALASILAVLPAGRLADRFPRRRILRASMVLLALAYVPVVVAPASFPAVLAATLLTGTGFALMFVSFNAYVPDLLAQQAMSSAYARSSAMSTLAGAAGPFVAAFVFDTLAGDAIAARTSALLFLGVGLLGALATLPLPPVGHDHAPRFTGESLRDAWRHERANVVPSLVVHGFLGAGYGATFPYFAVFFLDHLRAAPATWGYVLAAATFASAVGSLAAGRLATTVSPRRLILGPQLALALVSLAFLAPAGILLLGAAFVVRNLFSTTTGPMLNTLLMPRVAPERRGRVQAWGSLAWNLGWASGASVGGLLLARLDGGLFPLGAVVGLAGVMAGLAVLPRERATGAQRRER